jgi:hypothetical protein
VPATVLAESAADTTASTAVPALSPAAVTDVALARPTATTLGTAPDLRTQVGSLADALAAFNGSGGAATSAATTVTQLTAPQAMAGAGGASADLAGMVSALKQFDANGQALTSAASPSGATPVALNTTTTLKIPTDILATGK